MGERELSEIQRATTEYQRAIQEQMEDILLAIDRVNAEAEAEKLRIRAQGSEREATLKRSSKDSKSELENALEECRREVNATCERVDDALFMDECQLNDKIRPVQQTCDFFERELAKLQRS